MTSLPGGRILGVLLDLELASQKLPDHRDQLSDRHVTPGAQLHRPTDGLGRGGGRDHPRDRVRHVGQVPSRVQCAEPERVARQRLRDDRGNDRTRGLPGGNVLNGRRIVTGRPKVRWNASIILSAASLLAA
jgi:hypothetical protein